jgi:DNA polymerase-3 subunit delta'
MRRLLDEGKLGHAYLCQGDPLTEGKAFAEEMGVMLMSQKGKAAPEKIRHRVEARLHPDVHWVEPRGKLRQIRVDNVQLALQRIHEKSFEGGWKLVVFMAAERLNPSSGNKLLKSLEEPPANTLILLVSDASEQLLPTLRSRCQTLNVPRGPAAIGVWRESLIELLRIGPPRSLRARLDRAAMFRDFFDQAAQSQLSLEELESEEEELEEDVENARETEARRKIQRTVMVAVEEWYRDVIVCKQGGSPETLRYPEQVEILRGQADSLPLKSIFKIIENIRTAARRLNGNLPVQVVLEQSVF